MRLNKENIYTGTSPEIFNRIRSALEIKKIKYGYDIINHNTDSLLMERGVPRSMGGNLQNSGDIFEIYESKSAVSCNKKASQLKISPITTSAAPPALTGNAALLLKPNYSSKLTTAIVAEGFTFSPVIRTACKEVFPCSHLQSLSVKPSSSFSVSSFTDSSPYKSVRLSICL